MPEAHNQPPRPKPYVLSVKVVLHDSRGDILLLRRSASANNNPGMWDFPGGKADPGESFDAALAREVYEETGFQVTVTRVLGAAESESPRNRVAYLFMEGHAEGGTLRLSEEHDAAQWISRPALAEAHLAPQFIAFARQYALNR